MSRNYDKTFKIEAINLYKKSGRTAQSLALELGIPKSTFESWIRRFGKEGDAAFPGKGHVNSQDAEVHALRRELQHVRMERDILKKAVTIFSQANGKGSNS